MRGVEGYLECIFGNPSLAIVCYVFIMFCYVFAMFCYVLACFCSALLCFHPCIKLPSKLQTAGRTIAPNLRFHPDAAVPQATRDPHRCTSVVVTCLKFLYGGGYLSNRKILEFPNKFPETFRTMPEQFLDISRNYRRNVLAMFWTNPRHF